MRLARARSDESQLYSRVGKKIVHSLHGLKLAIHFGGALTDIHGLAHCNKRGWARADAGRADNGDNLRWRDVNHGVLRPRERDEKIKDRWKNRRHILIRSALYEKPLEVGRSPLLLA